MEKSTTIHEKKLWDVGREMPVVLKIYFNWKHSPFQFFENGGLMQTVSLFQSSYFPSILLS